MAPIEVTGKNILKALGIIVSIVTVTAGVVWAIRYDYIEQLKHENEALKASKDWKLPETLNSLNQLSDKVRLQIEEREKLDSLTSQRDALTKKSDDLQMEVSKLNAMVNELKATLKASIANMSSFDVVEGGSADLIKNQYVLGVEHIYPFEVEVNINNDSHRLKVGNKIEFSYANQNCVLQLKGIKSSSPEKSTYSFGCVEK